MKNISFFSFFYLLYFNRYDIVLEYYQDQGGALIQLSWSSDCQVQEIIPQSQLYPCITPANSNGDGLLAAYFSDTNLNNYVGSEVDPQINFNWNNGPSILGGQQSGFSVKWTGYIQPRFSGVYTFTPQYAFFSPFSFFSYLFILFN